MLNTSYERRRGEIETYFDDTAVDAWKRLTSDAPLGRIRKTVRAGREEMRATLLNWMPQKMTGLRVLDAGCGTGALALDVARRGAHVVATDLSKTLVELARDRVPKTLGPGSVEFVVGDMVQPGLGRFDYVVAMDSLIHYAPYDMVGVLAQLAKSATRGVLFTYAPRTPLLALMHTVGRAFPRGDRAPAIEPVSAATLQALVSTEPRLSTWQTNRTKRVANGFYTSQAMELVPA